MCRSYATVIFTVVTAFAGSASLAAAQDSTVTIMGTVVDSATHLPVSEVAIYVDGRSFGDTTDYAGEFAVRDLAGGTHVALLMSDGYTPATIQFTIPANVHGEVDVGIMPLATGPDPDAILTGTVVDSRTGSPVMGVEVSLNGQPAGATAVTGRFRIEDTPVSWGENILEFRRIGYAPMNANLWITQESTDLDLDVALVPSAVPLAEVVVEGDRTTYAVGLTRAFYRRRQIGVGTFFDEREIARINPRVVTDVLRRAPGVTTIRSSTGEELIRFRRTLTFGDCAPLLFLNGQRLSKIDDVNWFLSADVLLGVEMYQGAQIPIEFTQTGSACGVVVIWTK